ncbi:MAG: SDR family oxidoreductase [Parvibaculaceae bacterium]|nr:SDR family oxidoreductase [Parvibaculaceae bacterium]
MTRRKTAVVSGGLGVIGRNLVDHLTATGDWDVIALSRRAPDFETPARFVSIDLLDPASTLETIRTLGPIDYVFHAAYQEHADPAAQVEANTAMLRNLVTAVETASPSLERVVLYEGAKYYGVHLGAFPTPALEDDARHMPPNFYYNQEDWLKAAAKGKNWDYVVLRPDVVCGFAVGSPMNFLMVLGVYAAICRELGLPMRFPGTHECYNRLAQVTDAGQLARASVWAVEKAPAGEAYNLTNGDVFRWNRMWPALAASFGLEAGMPQTINLTEMMKDKGPVWDKIVSKHGLVPGKFEQIVAWGFGDFVFRCDFDVVSSTTKIRQAGFQDIVDSETMFRDMFAELRRRKLLP